MSSGKKLYFKLGAGASSFNDPKSGLNIAGDEVAAVDAKLAKSSKIVRNAKTNGHIVEVEESDFKSAKLKAPDVNASVEGGQRSESTTKASKDEAPNKDKATSHSPSGLPSSAGGQGSNSPADVDEDDEEDEDEEDELIEEDEDEEDEEDEAPAKAAPKKAAPKKGKGKKK
jgi:hypothetical protein